MKVNEDVCKCTAEQAISEEDSLKTGVEKGVDGVAPLQFTR